MGTTLSGTTPQSTYPALIKVGDNSALSATLKTLSDGAGNDLPMQVSTSIVNFTGNVGFGAPTPTEALTISGNINFLGSNRTIASSSTPLNAIYSDSLLTCRFIRDSGGQGILFTDTGGSAYAKMGVGNLNTTIGQSSTGVVPDLGARLGVRGSGSTSATTSLLVQRSSGDTIFQVQDDGSCTFGYSGSGSTATFYGNTGLQCIIGNDYLQTPSNITRVTNGQLTLYGRNNNANAFSFQHLNSQQTTASGVSMINIGGGYATQHNAQFSSLQITPSYDLDSNTTTNSIARGIYYNPTITNLRLAQHRAIETTTGDVLLNTTSGNTLIGSSASNTAKLSIKGSGSTSATNSLLVQNSSGNRLLEQKDNGWLYIGNTASDTGVIYVPHSPTYADRVFMRIDGGFPLFSTISNALLEISCAQFYTQGDMTLRNANTGIRGGTASNINNSSIQLSTQINAYNGTSQNDACSLVYIENRGATLQAAGSINWLKMDGNVYEAGGGGNKWCTGIYYNPSFTGGTLLANSHYCYHATSGQMMVNTTSPNASAQLQVDSTTRGFLPPRMTTAEKNAIATPAIGLMVFDTTLGRPCFYNGAWVTL